MEYEDLTPLKRREYRQGEAAFYEGKSVEDLCGTQTSTKSDEFMAGYYAAQEEFRLEKQNIYL